MHNFCIENIHNLSEIPIMNDKKWYLILSFYLVAASCLSYLIQLLIFHDQHNTFFYLLQDISFVPINVLLVTMLIDKLLQRKEKESLFKKINMIVGLFFNEIGMPLFDILNHRILDPKIMDFDLLIDPSWDDKKFNETLNVYSSKKYIFQFVDDLLQDTSALLLEKRLLLMQLMQNPSLMEHESFTDLLLAIFHLCDELSNRADFTLLPESDIKHLNNDFNRAYQFLITEWLKYLNHLKKAYPFLFSLAIRKNPFNPQRNILVTE